MASSFRSAASSLLATTIIIISLLHHSAALATQKSYIVYLGQHTHGLNPTDEDAEIATQSQYELLGSVVGSAERAQGSLFYSYNKYINGFAAVLSEEEVAKIRKSPGVVSVLENKAVKLHTTRSWEFLGLEHHGVVPSSSLWNLSSYGHDSIIGNLDTGVWPESVSFRDEGLGPVPARWKGSCVDESDHKVTCNKKLIGARYFNRGYAKIIGMALNASYQSARDVEGHGTHTLSTAGGGFVSGANVFGFGNGTAKGGSPNARVAAYKVCWPPVSGYQCITSDILAGFEAAIADGVDVLSVSLGGDPSEYKEDGIAIGAFHAVQHGITVVASAGNGGPTPGSVSNIAPWIFTIGASTMDREFTSWVSLGRKNHFKGSSLGRKLLPTRHFYPLIDAISAYSENSSSSADSAGYCLGGSLDPSKVKGRIVVCRRGSNGRVEKGEVVVKAGAVGMILANDESSGDALMADAHVLPAAQVSYNDGQEILAYIKKTKNPHAYITSVRTTIDTKPAPVLASFSSRGPNTITPDILKPDVTAPGVSIIAAYSGASSPAGVPDDKRRVMFNIESGTSMACPHVAGIVGLLKTLHPDWSPAAIRSAIMTTATTLDNINHQILDSSKEVATPYGYGAGHINPNAAADPGLVYELTIDDYLDFLCSAGLKEADLEVFSAKPHKCNTSKTFQDFNYPSITVTNFNTSTTTVTRSVKNVGGAGTYKVKITAPAGVSVSVQPEMLKFTKAGEVQKFTVSLKATDKSGKLQAVFGSLEWSDGTHVVRSPIAVERFVSEYGNK